ncbi:hypothetical protein HYC85_016845 [Camellia sinensis]|uniref:Uncharacterized protein n=1 Tax=Camellia sinensis TaxID=4442 RepID=A0A7J7H203_CAMSI|nr:hypothetical protein HYC85_016845 [Camellia sinensis]
MPCDFCKIILNLLFHISRNTTFMAKATQDLFSPDSRKAVSPMSTLYEEHLRT